MSDKVKVLIVVGVIVLVGVPILGKVLREGQKPSSGSSSGSSSAPAAPVKLEPPRLNTANLANTKWKMTIQGIPVEFALLPGGAATATAPGFGTFQGTWSVNGADLTVSANAMGQTHTQTAKISGDQILVDGKPIQRSP